VAEDLARMSYPGYQLLAFDVGGEYFGPAFADHEYAGRLVAFRVDIFFGVEAPGQTDPVPDFLGGGFELMEKAGFFETAFKTVGRFAL